MMPLDTRASEQISPNQHDSNCPAPLRFETLDVMRALAVLGVLAFHAYKLFIPFGESILYCTYYGYLGVQMFFVISGFCMMASAAHFRRQGLGGAAFLLRRLIRVFPPYWLALGFTVLAVPLNNIFFGLRDPFASGYYPYAKLSPGDWLAFLTLTRGFHFNLREISDNFSTINPVYWSLAIEVQFYLIVCLVLTSGRHARPILWGVTLAGVCAMFSPDLFKTGIFLPFWPAFAMGMGLYASLQRGLTPDRLLGARLAVWAPFVALALFFLYLNRAGYAIGERAFFFYLLFTLVLWTLYPFDGQLAALQKSRAKPVALAARIFFGIGTISYSIYLLHVPVVTLCDTILSRFMRPGIGYTLLLLSATCAFCYPFYVFCEKPFIGLGRPGRKETAYPARGGSAGPDATPVEPAIPVHHIG